MTTTTSPPPAVRGRHRGAIQPPDTAGSSAKDERCGCSTQLSSSSRYLFWHPSCQRCTSPSLDRPLYEAGGVLSLDNYVASSPRQVSARSRSTGALRGHDDVPDDRPRRTHGHRRGAHQNARRQDSAAAMQWPFFISSLILGFGWIMMYGPSGFVSVKVQQVLGHLPWNLYSPSRYGPHRGSGAGPDRISVLRQRASPSDASLDAGRDPVASATTIGASIAARQSPSRYAASPAAISSSVRTALTCSSRTSSSRTARPVGCLSPQARSISDEVHAATLPHHTSVRTRARRGGCAVRPGQLQPDRHPIRAGPPWRHRQRRRR